MSRYSSATRACVLWISLAAIGCTRQPDESGGSGPDLAAEPDVASVPDVMAPGNDGVLAFVAVPNLDAVFEAAAEFMKTFGGADAPDAATVRAQVGAMLDDPELNHIERAKPVLIVAFEPANPGEMPRLAGLVAAPDPLPYGETLDAMGVKTTHADGLALIGGDDAALERAGTVRGFYRRLAEAGVTVKARVYADVVRLMDLYEPLARMATTQLLASVAGAADQEHDMVAALLRAEALGFFAVAGQIESFQLDVDFGASGIDVAALVTAKPGSDLATLFAKSAKSPAPAAGVLPPGGGVMAGAYSIDAAAFAAFFEKVVAVLQEDPATKPVMSPEFVDLLTRFGEWWSGWGAFRSDLGDERLTMEHVIGVTDGALFLEAMEQSAALMKPGQGFARIYESLGMEVSGKFEKNVRRSGDVAVHKMSMSSAANAGAPAPFGAYQPLLNQQTEVAVVGESALMASGAGTLDSMVDAVRNGTKQAFPLRSRALFGGGRHIYVDYDALALMSLMLPGPQASRGGGDSGSLLVAVTFGKARSLLQLRIPSGLFTGLRAMSEAAVGASESEPEER